MQSHEDRIVALEKRLNEAEKRASLTTVVAYVADLLDERSYRDRHTTDRSRFWQRLRIRLVVAGVAVGIVTSTVNAVRAFEHPKPSVTYVIVHKAPAKP